MLISCHVFCLRRWSKLSNGSKDEFCLLPPIKERALITGENSEFAASFKALSDPKLVFGVCKKSVSVEGQAGNLSVEDAYTDAYTRETGFLSAQEVDGF